MKICIAVACCIGKGYFVFGVEKNLNQTNSVLNQLFQIIPPHIRSIAR